MAYLQTVRHYAVRNSKLTEMKKLILVATLLFMLNNLHSQTCLPGVHFFNSQEQIDNFPTEYPNCRAIEGSIYIEGNDINNLIGFSNINKFYSHLRIETCHNLYNLTGLNNVDTIGELIIHVNENLSDLSGFEKLKCIKDGLLQISDNNSLNSLTGLDSLNYVEKDIIISFNEQLISIDGLESISTAESITIEYNSSLSNITGLQNLSEVTADFIIQENGSIQDLVGLETLTTVGGDLIIKENANLVSINGLNGIDSISHLYITNNELLYNCNIGDFCNYLQNPKGSINIHHNAFGCNGPIEIAESCGFSLSCLPFGNYYFFTQSDIDNFKLEYPGCNDIKGDIRISSSEINNLIGFNEVTTIGGGLRIFNSDSLETLFGLDSIISVGHIWIHANDSLISISGLNKLDTVHNWLYLSSSNLPSLSGLENLKYVGGKLSIARTNTRNLLPLSNLNYLGGGLSIEYNDNLKDLAGLSNINSIGGELKIFGNDSLKNLNGLNKVTSIYGDVFIGSLIFTGNLQLNTLYGLESLETINGNLTIADNKSIKELLSLGELTSINGSLSVIYNDSLTSLSGLNNINSDSITVLSIANNPLLSFCEIESVCGVIANSSADIGIYGNDYGCMSEEEVELACLTGLTLFNFQEHINIYPNPVSNTLYISTTGGIEITRINLYNQLGRRVKTQSISTGIVDLSNIQSGLYICEIIMDQHKLRYKIIVN